MERRQLRLLDEALVKRTLPLKRVVTFRPSPPNFTGPPKANSTAEQKIDAALRALAMRFDLSLLLSGDKRFTRMLADEFVEEMNRVVVAEKLDREALRRRIVNLAPSIKRSASVFVDRLRYGLQTGRAAP